MYVKFRKELDTNYDPYTLWAKDYGVDLTKPFKVDHEDSDSYACLCPEGFKSLRPPRFVYLGKDFFFPVAVTTNLEDWL